MKVFKFGGGILTGAEALHKLSQLLQHYLEEDLIIVVSAIGKTTNLLEQLLDAYLKRGDDVSKIFGQVKSFHHDICKDLFTDDSGIWTDLNDQYVELDWILEDEPHDERSYLYDQMVAVGELLSSLIVARFLRDQGLPIVWHDARSLIVTDESYMNANVDLMASQRLLNGAIKKSQWMLTGGFIGGSPDNNTTTLGREGSDYSAALIGALLESDAVTLWKDVDGIYTGDPKQAEEVERLEELSYDEALAIMNEGAKVIHPKALHLLKEKRIPLYVRSFLDPMGPFSCVS